MKIVDVVQLAQRSMLVLHVTDMLAKTGRERLGRLSNAQDRFPPKGTVLLS